MPKIYFHREFAEVECEDGVDLRTVALDHGIDLYPGLLKYLNCRGKGLCGTCRVRVVQQDRLSDKTRAERTRIPETDPTVRLACQTAPYGDVDVQTFPRVRQGWMQHQCYQHLVEEVDAEGLNARATD